LADPPAGGLLSGKTEMYYVYVIKSQSSGKIYIGQTSDLEKRLKRHNKIINIKKTSYTYKNKGPWILVYKEIFSERKDATKREKQLKSAQGRKFIKEYICTHSSVGRSASRRTLKRQNRNVLCLCYKKSV